MSRVIELARLLSSGALAQSRLADHSGVILDLDSLAVFSVNDTGMCLVEGLREGIEDHQGLVQRVMEEFDVDEDVARADVDRFVDQLGRCLADRRV
jgi:hypothetical protein